MRGPGHARHARDARVRHPTRQCCGGTNEGYEDGPGRGDDRRPAARRLPRRADDGAGRRAGRAGGEVLGGRGDRGVEPDRAGHGRGALHGRRAGDPGLCAPLGGPVQRGDRGGGRRFRAPAPLTRRGGGGGVRGGAHLPVSRQGGLLRGAGGGAGRGRPVARRAGDGLRRG